MADQAIQIGELSRRTGCNIETIRYYERIGLLGAATVLVLLALIWQPVVEPWALALIRGALG